MRLLAPAAGAAIAGAALAAGPASAHDGAPHAGDGPRPLVLSVGRSHHAVPEDGFESLGYRRGSGLELCLTDAAERDVAAFTEAHLGAVVRVAIGETQVFALRVVEPYEGGCITWPVHPHGRGQLPRHADGRGAAHAVAARGHGRMSVAAGSAPSSVATQGAPSSVAAEGAS